VKAALLVLALALVPPSLGACASRVPDSERAWQRAQCGQVIDTDAREKCLERADRE
jgi:hypothetical protein